MDTEYTNQTENQRAIGRESDAPHMVRVAAEVSQRVLAVRRSDRLARRKELDTDVSVEELMDVSEVKKLRLYLVARSDAELRKLADLANEDFRPRERFIGARGSDRDMIIHDLLVARETLAERLYRGVRIELLHGLEDELTQL